MTPRAAALAAGLVVAAGCIDNPAPGNDREAELDPPARAAEVATAEAAISGVATGLLKPEIMTDADLESAPRIEDRCTFRFTRVGFPVLVYGSSGVLKLNGKLVVLPRVGDGRYGAGGVEVRVRPLDGGAERETSFAAEMVVGLPGAPDELGFHGYSGC